MDFPSRITAIPCHSDPKKSQSNSHNESRHVTASSTGKRTISSNGDDFPIDSTPASTPRSEYNVETILAEAVDDKNAPLYLVKWEDYPLHRATWEPANMFTTDVPLQDWANKKKRVTQGLETDFEVEEFQKSVDEEKDRRDERRLRRSDKQTARRSCSVSEGPESEGTFPEIESLAYNETTSQETSRTNLFRELFGDDDDNDDLVDSGGPQSKSVLPEDHKRKASTPSPTRAIKRTTESTGTNCFPFPQYRLYTTKGCVKKCHSLQVT